MNYMSIGDMAQTFQLRRHDVALKTQISRLTAEMTTGRKSDLASAVGGDFRALAGLDRSLAALGAYKVATDEAGLFARTVQTALGTVAGLASDLATGLMTASTTGTPQLVDITAGDARQKLDAAVGALNARVADRYVLSGTATDAPPLAGTNAMLAELVTATAGQTTVTGVEAAVTAWFDAPVGGGGFLDTVYGGSATALAPVSIGDGSTVEMDVMATDPVVREMLKGLAMGALLDEGVLAGSAPARAQLARRAADTLITAGSDMAALQAHVGTVEGHIDDIATRNGSETSALEMARNVIIAADPYQSATALSEVQTQMETLYALTARLSRLSLADYLR